MNNYEDVKNELTEFINGPRLTSLFEGKSNEIKDIIQRMFYCIDLLQNDKELKEDDPKIIKEKDLNSLTDSIMYCTVERQTIQKDLDNLKNLAMLVFNYNQNTLKLETVAIRVSFITNFIDGFLSFRDCLELFKGLSERLNRYSTYNLPSFELSKHYIDTIFSDSNDKKCKE